jgi:hypothetical protein
MQFRVIKTGRSTYDHRSIVIGNVRNEVQMISRLANFMGITKIKLDRKAKEFEFINGDTTMKFKFEEIPEPAFAA